MLNRTGQKQADIIVVGAGMVGYATALCLARSGFSINLIEDREPAPWNDEVYGVRVSAISAASEKLLDDMGVWQDIVSRRVMPYQHMHVWDASGSASLDFDAADSGRANLGYIIENDLITSILSQHLRRNSSVSIATGSRLSAVEQLADAVQVVLDDGSKMSAALIVAADGANSDVRRIAGISSRTHDYQQTGIVARIQTSLPHQDTAWQRFLPGSILAFLPLQDGSCSIVWSADNDQAQHLLALDDEDFSRQLAEAFEYQLGEVRVLGPRAGFPLTMANAEAYSADRLVLLGDAAHRVHPLAGQGVNLGFQDVGVLSATLGDAVANGRDVADPMYLRKYSRTRRAQAGVMLTGMHGIQRVFSTNSLPVIRSRNIAMDLINRTPLIKRLFVDRALGG
jgi:ubiquinone biosynthesis UbiH/UbiF/VisC/COQ6 family hydroxylase